MPKRFTETLKWDDPWFRALSPDAKLLWFWLVDKCDLAGIIEPDFGLCEFQTGIKQAFEKMVELESRITDLGNGKYIIDKFIEFQHGKLSRDCRAHNPAFQTLEKHGLLNENDEITLPEKGIDRVSIPYGYRPCIGKGNGNGTSKGIKSKNKVQERPTIDEVRVFVKSLGLPESDGDYMFHHWESNGWTKGGKPIKSWQATIRSWKSVNYMPSQKPKEQRQMSFGVKSTHETRHHGEIPDDSEIPDL